MFKGGTEKRTLLYWGSPIYSSMKENSEQDNPFRCSSFVYALEKKHVCFGTLIKFFYFTWVFSSRPAEMVLSQVVEPLRIHVKSAR